MKQAGPKPLHMKYWLSVQQALDHLRVLAEEEIGSEGLAKLVEERHLSLYWHRPGQRLSGGKQLSKHSPTLDQPLRLYAQNHSDWRAIVGILRHHPALPAAPNDTPLLEDDAGNLLHITFDFSQRPEPYSGSWYPSYTELVVKRRDLERLQSQLFIGRDEAEDNTTVLTEEPQFLLEVIAQLEKLAMAAHSGGKPCAPDIHWLAQQLADSDENLDHAALKRVLTVAERRS